MACRSRADPIICPDRPPVWTASGWRSDCGRCRALRRGWRSAVRRRRPFAQGSGSLAYARRGPIQACGVEHRRAAGHRIGQDVAAGVGCPAYRLLGGAGAGQLARVGEVDADLEYLWFGFEHRGEAGDEVLGGKEPPALAQVQPEPSVDLSAELRELGGGPRRGGMDEFEESVALSSIARSGADRPVSTTRKRPTRDASRQQFRNEFMVCSVVWRSGPATRLTVISASPGPAIRLHHSASGYDEAASSMAGTEKSRLAVIRCRSPSGMSGRASRRRHSVNASACLPIRDAQIACSSVARQA